jgi:CheY-like chemotaxis protein
MGREIGMLASLGEEIRLCYREAEDCARRAETAPTETLRADHLRRERSWLELARSYELQQRLALFINEDLRGKIDGRTGHVAAAGAATATAWVEPPASDRTVDDPEHLQDELIAIVDDDDYARRGLRALIESRGCSAAALASAEDYLASAANESIACLILDVHLPGMSGPDLQARLIAGGRCPPTVFVTGRFEEHLRKRVIAAGALGYLSKPCNEKALFDCIEKAQLKSVRRPLGRKRSAI